MKMPSILRMGFEVFCFGNTIARIKEYGMMSREKEKLYVIDTINNSIDRYKMRRDLEYSREQSWEHCYLAFSQLKADADDAQVDYLSLHLMTL